MKKILIADDDPDILMLLASRLKANNYNVVLASDCNQAIKKAYSVNPDLILMDIKMPTVGGVSAFESLQMYSRTESIPVIFITAYPSAEIKKKVLEMGATDFIAKPFTPEELLPKVKRALNEDSVAIA